MKKIIDTYIIAMGVIYFELMYFSMAEAEQGGMQIFGFVILFIVM